MRTIKRDIVGAFIFSKDNKILLGKSIKGGVYPDLWVVPGGGINHGEKKIDAVKRELKEEVGLLIKNEQITEVGGHSTGKSEKTLRDTKERVMVNMTFYDYIIDLPINSEDAKVVCDDDFVSAKWFYASEVKAMKLGPATMARLKSINFID